MRRRMTATEVKAKFLALLDEVSSGEEVEITKHGRLVARLVPAASLRPLGGKLVGMARTVSDDDDVFTTGLSWDLP